MQRIINYGSYMQALSLKTMIEELGNEVCFVDYVIDVPIEEKGNLKKILKQKITRSRLWKAYLSPINNIVRHQTMPNKMSNKQQSFLQAYERLAMTEKYHYHVPVDVLVIGSDEVFNCLQRNPDVGYSLELFGKKSRAKKLISYAASFGNTTYERLIEYGVEKEIGNYLSRFDSISVRDKNSETIINRVCQKEPLCHMDPVFVGSIEKMRWKENNEKNYIVIYGYSNRFSEEEIQDIKKFAAEENLHTIGLCEAQDFCDKNIECSPEEIIPYFQNADYIITDTFHGVIFSMICHKKFAVFCRKKSNTEFTNAEKLLDLLERTETLPRLVDEKNKIDKILKTSIDYSRLDEIRTRERIRTIQYLRENTVLKGRVNNE